MKKELLLRTAFYHAMVCVVIAAVLFLGGCAGGSDVVSQLVKLPTGEIVSTATDRFGSWERAISSQNEAKGKWADMEKAKYHAELNKPKVTIAIDTKDEMTMYTIQRANENIAASNLALKEVAIALANNGKTIYSDLFPEIKFPKGAFAEGFESFGKGARDVLGSPAAVIGSTGYAVGQFAGSFESGRQQTYQSVSGDIVVDHKESSVAIGDENQDISLSGIQAQEDNCATGDCEEGSETLPGDPDFGFADCIANPPGGFSESGTPMYNDTLSCGSYFE